MLARARQRVRWTEAAKTPPLLQPQTASFTVCLQASQARDSSSMGSQTSSQKGWLPSAGASKRKLHWFLPGCAAQGLGFRVCDVSATKADTSQHDLVPGVQASLTENVYITL